MHITVAICTWNRSRLLDRTLAGLGELRIPAGVEWEVLVVNNNCTDGTDDVLRSHQGRLPLRRLHEPRPGKSHAANLAIAEARGDLIAWTDDDVIADAGWVAEYAKAARDWPDAAFFGGTVDPWFEVEPPRWFRRHLVEYDYVYAVRRLGDATRPLREGELPFGANMAIRRGVLHPGSFDANLGPSGSNQVRGEELDLLNRLLEAGHAGVWVGPARVRHYIPAHRISEHYLWEWHKGHGRELVQSGRFDGLDGAPGVPRWVWTGYCERRLGSLLCRYVDGRRWCDHFKRAAVWAGVIDQLQSQAGRVGGREARAPGAASVVEG